MIGMGKGGQRPKPTSIKILNGNPGKKPLNLDEPKPPRHESLTAFPDPPDHLSDDAKAAWTKNAPDLFEGGTLLISDIAIWEEFCTLHGRMTELNRQMREDGAPNGIIPVPPKKGTTHRSFKLHPNNTIIDRMFSRHLALASHFGMTPASRSRIRVEKKRNKDPFSDFMSPTNGTP